MSMTIADLFRDLWEEEHHKTLSVLEAIPGDQMKYVPWPGAMEMRRLALHVIGLDEQMIRGVLAGELIAGGSRRDQPEVRTPADLVAYCKAQHEALLSLVAQLDEAVMGQEFPFRLPQGPVVRLATGRAYLFSHLLHHLVHHRAQLLAYLRLSGALVPGLYGPAREQTPPLP